MGERTCLISTRFVLSRSVSETGDVQGGQGACTLIWRAYFPKHRVGPEAETREAIIIDDVHVNIQKLLTI